jgi:hypothetical protein
LQPGAPLNREVFEVLNITQDQAEKIAFVWLIDQETSLNIYGGYPGELFVVKDRLVWFINCNGEKSDGPSVAIRSIESALKDWDDEHTQEVIEELDGNWREYETFFGESVPSLANYLRTADGDCEDSYDAGNPYKQGAPALKRFM